MEPRDTLSNQKAITGTLNKPVVGGYVRLLRSLLPAEKICTIGKCYNLIKMIRILTISPNQKEIKTKSSFLNERTSLMIFGSPL